MDAPNNLVTPNAQDQFVDTVQGPANQAQGPAVQNQAQGSAVQNQVQGPTQVGQNMPVQPPQLQVQAQPGPVGPIMPAQPAPVQPVPVGLVVPAPQVFYQNCIGKKPEFSGKPEENVESYLLMSRDWMEVHNFPNEVKVRCF